MAKQAPGEYQHVSIVQEFDSPKLGPIKYLRDKISLGNEAKADSKIKEETLTTKQTIINLTYL